MISYRLPLFTAALLAVFFVLFSATVFAAQTPSDPVSIAREIIEDGPYQTTLEQVKPRPERERRREWDFSWLKDLFSVLETLGPVLSTFIYIACFALVVLLLFALFRGLSFHWRRGGGDLQEEEAEGAELGARTRRFDSVGTLSDADALAAAGHYSEAVRVLLFRSLEFLRRGIGDAVFPFLTSREILLVSGLDTAERDALRRIVAVEEIAHFGETLLNAEAYQNCRRDFLVFSGEGRGGAA